MPREAIGARREINGANHRTVRITDHSRKTHAHALLRAAKPFLEFTSVARLAQRDSALAGKHRWKFGLVID